MINPDSENYIFLVKIRGMSYRNQFKEPEVWRTSPKRKPLIICVARQVGKTTLIQEFDKPFSQYIYLYPEQKKDVQLFASFNDIGQLLARLFLKKQAAAVMLHHNEEGVSAKRLEFPHKPPI
ncbi:MAG: hypothetical protein ACLFMU_07130 [Bacteroidales bacterium]